MLKFSLRVAALSTRAPFFWAVCACLLAASMAHAAEFTQAEQNVPALFEQYQPWRDEPLQNWREANDRMGGASGELTDLRKAQQANGGMSSDHHEHHGH